jgi:ferritin-like metal-binding protein YciE
MSTLKDLFLDQLEDMYDSEQRITKALPKLIVAASCNDLKSALETHLQETKGQIDTLERVFQSIDAKVKGKTCPAMAGILKEGEELVSDYKKTTNINAAIICAAQKVEHYEIATYGCLRAWANKLGHSDAASLLEEILDEEKGANQTLNDLSTSKNEEALEEVEAGALRR